MSDLNLRSGMLRRASLRGVIIAGIVLAIALILLGLTGSFIVDWLWFGEVGYFGVFWTIVVGVCTPTSFHVSCRCVAGSAPR